MKYNKIQHSDINISLTKNLFEILVHYRKIRNFGVKEYIELKSLMLNDYLLKNKINTLIIPVSGGIDSSVVLAIIKYAQNKENSPIKHVIPVNISCFNENIKGVTNQKITKTLSEKLCNNLNYELQVLDISPVVNSIKKVTENLSEKEIDYSWSEGQLIPCIRTSISYYLTSLFNEKLNMKSIIVGTNNFDELSYIGFFGKSSDGLNDLQLISDIHKSEVYLIADFLNIPKEIIERKPNGDMFHGKDDEEFFGFSYDFLELYSYYLSQYSFRKEKFFINFNENDLIKFNLFSENIEKLHEVNKHKYEIFKQYESYTIIKPRSVSIHLNIYSHEIMIKKLNQIDANESIIKNFVGYNPFRFIQIGSLKNINRYNFIYNYISNLKNQTFTCNKINEKEIYKISSLDDDLINYLSNIYEYAVNKDLANLTGYSNKNTNKPLHLRKIGSIRSSFYNTHIAHYFFELINRFMPNIIKYEDSYWKPVSVNPYFRFINYPVGSWLVPHYDSSVKINSDNKEDYLKTLFSILISLTDNDSGNTEFIKDINLIKDNPFKKDYDHLFTDKSFIYHTINHNKGDIHIFPHDLLHQVTEIQSKEKLIIRTDLVFKKIY